MMSPGSTSSACCYPTSLPLPAFISAGLSLSGIGNSLHLWPAPGSRNPSAAALSLLHFDATLTSWETPPSPPTLLVPMLSYEVRVRDHSLWPPCPFGTPVGADAFVEVSVAKSCARALRLIPILDGLLLRSDPSGSNCYYAPNERDLLICFCICPRDGCHQASHGQ